MFMRSLKVIAVALLLTGMLFGQDGAAEKEAVGTITFPLNRVFVIPAGTANLEFAGFNMPIYAGDKIQTKKESRCEITLVTGDVIRIDENSLFTIEALVKKDSTVQVESSLSFGRIWANIRKLFSGEESVKVKSPSAVIAVRGTIYRIDANEDQSTEVRVYEGAVSVEPALAGAGVQDAPTKRSVGIPGQPMPQPFEAPTKKPEEEEGEKKVERWQETIMPQHQIIVKADGTFELSTFDAASDSELSWVEWNRRRDRMVRR